LLSESRLARKTLASVEIAMAKKKRLKLKRSAKMKSIKILRIFEDTIQQILKRAFRSRNTFAKSPRSQCLG
jgi:hypothetical protein